MRHATRKEHAMLSLSALANFVLWIHNLCYLNLRFVKLFLIAHNNNIISMHRVFDWQQYVLSIVPFYCSIDTFWSKFTIVIIIMCSHIFLSFLYRPIWRRTRSAYAQQLLRRFDLWLSISHSQSTHYYINVLANFFKRLTILISMFVALHLSHSIRLLITNRNW